MVAILGSKKRKSLDESQDLYFRSCFLRILLRVSGVTPRKSAISFKVISSCKLGHLFINV